MVLRDKTEGHTGKNILYKWMQEDWVVPLHYDAKSKRALNFSRILHFLSLANVYYLSEIPEHARCATELYIIEGDHQNIRES